ncbi:MULTISPECIES: hypothetical protein [unclassified Bradyrhizobium]|uniref:hypothetical protein n=1 Tax=unclassified Bradyrhizobium TaxID=2631580 RepID=UPI0024E0960C|nr:MULTISPECIES: hypothetical protein [unclassified Bradyrhizobium]
MAAVLLALGVAATAPPAAAQSLTDRFKSLFGGGSDDKGQQDLPASGGPPADPTEGLTCPQVNIRAGASTYAVAAPGKQAVGNDVRFQASITKTARECNLNGAEIVAKIGIQGRIVAGPAGAPATVDIPMRIAVVQGGIGEKVIATKAYRTTVQMSGDGSVPFTIVAEDMVYPVPPPGANADNYVFYIGFDPQALTPERAAKKRK